MSSRKIFIYNYAIAGYDYLVKPINTILKKKYSGYEIIFLHSSSINSDKDTITKKPLDIESIDISYYSTKKILKLFNNYKPSLFINFVFRSLFDVMLFFISSKAGVKSLIIQHGIFDPDSTMRFSFHNKIESIKRYNNYLLKLLHLVLLSKSFVQMKEIVKAAVSSMIFNDYEAIPIDYAIYYSEESSIHIQNILKIKKENVYYSGYPLFTSNAEIQEANKQLRSSEYILFLHQPFVKMKTTSLKLIDEINLFKEWANIVAKKGYKLIIKLHPRASVADYHQYLQNHNSLEIADEDMLTLTRNAKYIIGMFSTALFYATYFNKQIFIYKYSTKKRMIKNIFEEVGIKFSNSIELEKLLDKNNYLPDYSEFNKKYLGKNNSFENQLDTIIEIINKGEK